MHAIEMSSGGGDGKRRFSVGVDEIDGGAETDQSGNDAEKVVPNGAVERRLAVTIACVDVTPSVARAQRLDHS